MGRQAILSRTFSDPGRAFHVRELARRTGLAPRTVQVEVDRLVAAGLLADYRDGNRRYLKANTRHPLFQPIREIVLKTDGLAGVLADALGTDGIELAFVFGSMASSTATAGSDVDLLVVGSAGLREVTRRLAPAHDQLGREINPVVWTREEYERRRTDGDPFLTRVLTGPRLKVVETRHDQPAAT